MADGIWRDVQTLVTEAEGWRTRLFGIFIDGVEVTQAIQYRRAADHLTDAADRGPDNSVRLVADKPAYVRVYVRTNLRAVEGVRGRVTVQKRRHGIWRDAGTLMQVFPAEITAEPAPTYATERGFLSSSLNFAIPAATMRGYLRLKVHVEVPKSTRYVDDTEVDVDASLLQTLHVRGIPVQYWGPDPAGNQVKLAPATLANFQTETAWTLRAWPVSQTPDVSVAGTFTWDQPLSGNITSGFCPLSWNNLLFWLKVAKVLDGNRSDRLYYALLPNGIPVGNVGGCGGAGTGVGAGFVGNPQTMAHELGHVLTFNHAPCNLVTGDTNDPSYPAYEPYDTANNRTASIGEYGLDPTTGTIYPPSTVKDFMSYCGPAWISLYHYGSLLQNSQLDPTWVMDSRDSYPPYFEEEFQDPVPHHIPDPPPPWVSHMRRVTEPDPVPLVVVTGVMRDDRIEIGSVLRLETGPTPGGERLEGTYVELLDGEGNRLERAPLRLMAVQASCGCGGAGAHGEKPTAGVVQALLPDPGEGAALRVVRGDEEIWSRRAPSERPEVDGVEAEVEGDELRVRWRAAASDEHGIERAVRWSADDGRSWQTLTLFLHEDEAVVPIELLSAGTVLVQVLVSDGFHTVVGGPVKIDVPRRPPQVAILWPAEGRAVRTDGPVRLWGVATAGDGRALQGDDLRWELDGEAVGAGREVWIELADWEGEHRCTLTAVDGDLRAEASVVFLATGSGTPPHRLRRD